MVPNDAICKKNISLTQLQKIKNKKIKNFRFWKKSGSTNKKLFNKKDTIIPYL